MNVHEYSLTQIRNRILCSGLQEMPRNTSPVTPDLQAQQDSREAAKFNPWLHSGQAAALWFSKPVWEEDVKYKG